MEGKELKYIGIVLLAIFFSGSAFASSECDNAQDQGTLNKCADQDLIKADKKLNSLYQKLERRLSDNNAKKLLTTSQRAWIKFRDAECDFSASGTEGGTIQPMIYATCRAILTTDRSKQLSEYLKCEEGDLSCPQLSSD